MSQIVEDYGEPVYVEAHGGKNHVILYRSKADPNLAVEFFFRSCSKDGRSRYYRCTKCWYLYKMNRGTCATLIVRDGRIITDPENPVVPHQCDFRPLEAVTANRAWIAGRKRRAKPSGQLEFKHHEKIVSNVLATTATCYINEEAGTLNQNLRLFLDKCVDVAMNSMEVDGMSKTAKSSPTDEGTFVSNLKPNVKSLDANPTWLKVRERLTGDQNIEETCDSPSSSTSHSSFDNVTTGAVNMMKQEELSSSTDQERSTATIPRHSLINAAFDDSIQKHYEDAILKLKKAVEAGEVFDIDDISLIDNVYSCKMSKIDSTSKKIKVCEEWLGILTKVSQTTNGSWLAHYQLSLYYCYHLIGAILDHSEAVERHRFFSQSQSTFRNLLELCTTTSEVFEDSVGAKLDILLSLSYLCLQFNDVASREHMAFVENETSSTEMAVNQRFPIEVASHLLRKVVLISRNLEQCESLQFRTSDVKTLKTEPQP